MAGIRVGYVRVSTPNQNPDRQISEIKADKFFVDKYTGKTLNRPEFQAMMNFLREGDTLIVHSFDRVGRNLNDLRNVVLQLVNKGVTVEFLNEKLTFDKTPTSFGLLMLSIMGAFAEFERSVIRERSLSGIAEVKAKGLKCGGRNPKFTPKILEEIEKMHSLGMEKQQIAKYLCISRTSVFNYLKLKGPATQKALTEFREKKRGKSEKNIDTIV